MFDVVNLQRKIKIDTAAFRGYLTTLLATVEEVDGRTPTVAFVSDGRMKQLNSFFRGKDATTDVLSFPHESDEFDKDSSNLGDIVISLEQAQKQAGENGLTLDLEIKQLMLHGLLHLCGYDHEIDSGEMNARELELRSQMNI